MSTPATISAEALHEKVANGENAAIIDVREPDEYASLHAAGAVLLPLAQVNTETVGQCLSGNAAAYFICHTGARATEACKRIMDTYPGARVVEGGTLAWAQAGLPAHSGREP